MWLPYHKRDNVTERVKDFLGIVDGAAASVERTAPPLLVSGDEGRRPLDFAAYQARVPNLPELIEQYLEAAGDLTGDATGTVRSHFDAHSVHEILSS